MNLIAQFPSITIFGAGVVGKSTGHLFGRNVKYIDLDSDKEDIDIAIRRSDYVIICVPTPTVDGKQNIQAITDWLKIIEKKVKGHKVIIRSTVLPTTCKKLSKKYKLQIAHVPEFLTEATALYDAEHPEILVIGADDIIFREEVFQLFNSRVEAKKAIQCDLTTAETIKYTINSWFALKVVFANEIWDLANEVGASYGKIREVLEQHKWGSKNGWDVWQGGFRGAGGKCLPKDLWALTDAFDLPLLSEAELLNSQYLNKQRP